ncbi:uncharacterized protein A4U43_C04F8230 [Asparagus officinalis]|uniref:Multiprotein bridging factor 1 N-terminal domain-containing protein n=1 Tax=Asparagus officinalis TaxID=4686 RepID=A0A5P1F1X1_ASPOF|nr:uncharacterized protein A4U43_C04F8230 [Asparagus officinalis]
MAGVGPISQDWKPVVVRKKAPNAAVKKDEKAVNAARRSGDEIEAIRKCVYGDCGGSNRQGILERLWKVSACDICEIATNSVYQSGFSHALKLCQNPRPKPDIKTPTNHTCAPTNGARPPPSTNGTLVWPIPKSGPFLPLRTNSTGCLEDIECVVQAPEFLRDLQDVEDQLLCDLRSL